MNYDKVKEVLNKEIISSISLEELSILMSQLSLLCDSGVNISECLLITAQGSKVSTKNMLNRVNERIYKGISLSDAIREESFDSVNLLSSMIESGEMTGSLSTTLRLMSEYYKLKAKNRKEIMGSLIYPIILFIVSILVILFMMIYIIPSYISIFESRNAKLPRITSILISFSKFLVDNLLLINIIIFIIILTFVYLYKNNSKFRIKFDRLLLKIPIVSRYNLFFLYTYTSFCISILARCNVPMLKILKIIMEGSNNYYFKEVIENIYYSLEKGESLSSAFSKEEIFSDLFLSMLRSGEKSGRLEDIMEDTGEYYSERLTESLKYMGKIFEPVMILFMTMIVGFIVFAIAMPMFDLVNVI